MATLRVAAPSRASAFSRGTAPVALRTGARPVASKSRGGVTVRAGFFDFLQPKEEEEAPAAKSGGTKSICLDCGYIAGACQSRGGDLEKQKSCAVWRWPDEPFPGAAPQSTWPRSRSGTSAPSAAWARTGSSRRRRRVRQRGEKSFFLAWKTAALHRCTARETRLTWHTGAGSNYRNLMAAKQAAKKAKASAPKGQRPRDLLRERAIEMAREKDAGKGGKTGKGWF